MNDLYRRLKLLPYRKVRIDRVKFAFADVYPELSSHPDRIAYLNDALSALERTGLIRLPSPKNRRAWLTESMPNLPAWIVLNNDNDAEARTDPAQIPWLSELSFCSELKHPALIDVAVAINKFLIENRHRLILVPLRERSLQIFGDEKRLDALVEDGALFGGRLPLAAIGAFEVDQPLAYQSSGVNGRPILVVENHHTYWSFCEWNARTRRFSAVVYGCGNAFVRAGRAIDDVLRAAGGDGIEYFGDLDIAGLEIPVRFNRTSSNPSSCPVLPAVDLYSWLLSHGIRRPCKHAGRPVDQAAVDWLPPPLATPAFELFTSSLWIPQESLGTEALLRDFS